jgi:hypothetical protein
MSTAVPIMAMAVAVAQPQVTLELHHSTIIIQVAIAASSNMEATLIALTRTGPTQAVSIRVPFEFAERVPAVSTIIHELSPWIRSQHVLAICFIQADDTVMDGICNRRIFFGKKCVSELPISGSLVCCDVGRI